MSDSLNLEYDMSLAKQNKKDGFHFHRQIINDNPQYDI